MKGNFSSFTFTSIHLFIISCFYLFFPSCSIFIFDYYWFLFTFPFNLPALVVPLRHALHPLHPQTLCFLPASYLRPHPAPYLNYLSSPPTGGWGEPAGLQWAEGNGGAEEDGSSGQTEVAEEGRTSESHPASGPSPAAPPTLPQLTWGQSLQSGPQQDSRDRCFVLTGGNILALLYHEGWLSKYLSKCLIWHSALTCATCVNNLTSNLVK